MLRPSMLLVALLVWLVAPVPGSAAADATLFRVFLVDGTSVISFGEVVRVDQQVIFSMPVGGTPEEPRLHPVTLDASVVDWARTEQYAASARYQQYAPRAEADYQKLTEDVAALLSRIASSTDRASAQALAEQARAALADWPRTHYGYRQEDVREIVALLDGAIARLQGTTPRAFEVELVAAVEPSALEPLAGMPTPREQVQQLLGVLRWTTTARDRVPLLQAALVLLNEHGAAMNDAAMRATRKGIEAELRQETAIDQRYVRLSRDIVARAARAAGEARITDVERALDSIGREDERLGRRRPEIVHALTTSVQMHLARARELRLLRDQWSVRQALLREYQRQVGRDLVQLVKLRDSLEAIRTLRGPDPERLASERTRLSGGAARLQRMTIPDYLRTTHDLVVGAWRFAETAVNTRSAAVSRGDVTTAWEASSAAAAAMMMLGRAQQELRALLTPPTLQ